MAGNRSILDWLDRFEDSTENETQPPGSPSISDSDSFSSSNSIFGAYSPLSLQYKYYDFLFEIARVVNYSGYQLSDPQSEAFKAFHIFAKSLLVTLGPVKERQLEEEFEKNQEELKSECGNGDGMGEFLKSVGLETSYISEWIRQMKVALNSILGEGETG